MTKLVMALGGASLAALATVLAMALAGTPDQARTVATLPAATTTTATTEDVRGPCDEAEHARDPRCAGVTTRPEDDDAGEREEVEDRNRADDRRADDVREPGEDLRGPCDEAEHANDPRCTGAEPTASPATTTADDDRADDHGVDDDRGGSNSGPGGDDDSGSGSGSDDRGGSNSGRG